MFNNNFAGDWSRTADLWYRKRLLYQLSHNHFLGLFFLFSFFDKYSTNFDYKSKKCRWCAWDSNLGWQDVRRRQIH